MFFIMGIMPGEKEIAYNKTVTCAGCGAYSRYIVYMTYSVLTLFFIPIFKFGKKYYVKSRCCNRVYLLNNEIGKKIANGADVEISANMLSGAGSNLAEKHCVNCGYSTYEDFEFCPKCGTGF